jgi:GxxExxY protein
MTENEISKIIVDMAMKTHTALGPGLLESVYETVLAFELRKNGLRVKRQVMIPIIYESLVIKECFRADLVIDEKVIIELKSISKLENVHYKQLLTYLRLSGKKLGLLINFNELHLKDGIKRIVNGLYD